MSLLDSLRSHLFPRHDLHVRALEAADRLIIEARGLRRELEEIACNQDPIAELVQRIHRCKDGDCANDRDRG